MENDKDYRRYRVREIMSQDVEGNEGLRVVVEQIVDDLSDDKIERIYAKLFR